MQLLPIESMKVFNTTAASLAQHDLCDEQMIFTDNHSTILWVRASYECEQVCLRYTVEQ